MKRLPNAGHVFACALLLLCALVPWLASLADDTYWPNVFMRTMIWAIAAISLNLILGFGGMVSFGHAVYLGIGAYSVGILTYYEITNGWIQLLTAIGACALISLIFGAISLRTRGVYFIMITMALAQMLYFLAISAEEYGSDDGLVIYDRSDFGLSLLDLNNNLTLYYAILAVLVLCLLTVSRLVGSRFGRVIRGAKANEERMLVIGYPVYRYRLVCFVIAGVMAGIAGFLSANVESFVSPDMMHWTRSGELIFMVVLGGTATLFGPLAGAMVFWLLSEFLPRLTEHWHLIFGPLLILVVLFARNGIYGLFDRGQRP